MEREFSMERAAIYGKDIILYGATLSRFISPPNCATLASNLCAHSVTCTKDYENLVQIIVTLIRAMIVYVDM